MNHRDPNTFKLIQGIASLSFVIFVHRLTGRTVLRTTLNEQTKIYTGTTYNSFLQKKTFTFRTQDVKLLGKTYSYKTLTGSMTIKNKNYIVVPGDFRSPAEYHKMIGSKFSN